MPEEIYNSPNQETGSDTIGNTNQEVGRANQEEKPECITNSLNKKMSRRGFLKLALVAAGAAALTACNGDEIFSAEQHSSLTENKRKFNDEFAQIEANYLNADNSFDYERFKTNPEFERYITEIHTNSEKMGQALGINPNALKLLTSSIISANLGSWENINTNQPPNTVRERIGPMQFYVTQALDNLRSELKDNYNYTTSEINGVFNIQIGMNYLVYNALSNVDLKSGGNAIELTLAQYYGGEDLVNHVKDNRPVAEGSFLSDGYDRYQRTVQVMHSRKIPEAKEDEEEVDSIEASLNEIWNKAVVFWPNTNLEQAKTYLYREARRYAGDPYPEVLGLSPKEYLAAFVSIVMAESNGGTNIQTNPKSGAKGWFQVVPRFHLGEYNEKIGIPEGHSYTEDDLLNDTEASIKVGAWALMRYRNTAGYQSMRELMKVFKGGWYFPSEWDDGIWWNRVSYCTTNLLGHDKFGMGYIDYQFPEGVVRKAEEFLANEEHIGNTKINA
jgi:hypothetical protein